MPTKTPSSVPHTERDPTLRQLLAMLYQWKYVVLSVFLITAGAVGVGAYMMPPVYSASSSVLVKFGREFIYRPEVAGLESARAFTLDEMVNSLVEILRSRDLARQVVEDLGVDTLYPSLLDAALDDATAVEKAVAEFQDNVSVTSVFDSSIIKISFVHGNRNIVARALNVLVEKLKDKHIEVFGDTNLEFLNTQVDRYRRELEEAETALEAFKSRTGIYELPAQKSAYLNQRFEVGSELRAATFRVSELQEELKAMQAEEESILEAASSPEFSRQRTALVTRRSELRSLLQDAESRVAELTKQLERFGARKGKIEGQVPPQPGVENFNSLEEARIRLLDLELRYLELRSKYNRDSREADSVRQEVTVVKQFLKERGEYVGDVLEAGIRDELHRLQTRSDTLTEQIKEIDSDLRSLVRSERSLQTRAISAELASLRFKNDVLSAELRELEEEIAKFSANEKTLRQLEREVTVSEQRFQAYLLRYEEARTTEELDEQKIVNLRVVEKAAPPIGPAGVPRKTKLAIGVVVGLLAGVAAAFFLELLRR